MAAILCAALPALATAVTNVPTSVVGFECRAEPVEFRCTVTVRSDGPPGADIGVDAFEDLNSRNRPEAMRVDFTATRAGTFSHEAFCTPEEGVVKRMLSLNLAECSVNFSDASLGRQTITASFSSENVMGTFYEPSVGTRDVVIPPAPTTLQATCNPAKVTAGTPTTCTAEVNQLSAIPTPPSGTVTFQAAFRSSFPGTQCSLVSTGAHSARCGLTFIPLNAITPGALSAVYSGAPGEFVPSGPTAPGLIVENRQSQTVLQCDRTSVAVGQQTHCTVRVLDRQPIDTIVPEGIVRLSHLGADGVDSRCTLVPVVTVLGESSCQLSYTPRAVGSGVHKLVASMEQSEGGYVPSSDSLELQVVAPARVSLILSEVTLARKGFRVGAKVRPGKKAVGGGVLRLTSSAPATLSISIDSLARTRGRAHRKPKPKHVTTLSATVSSGPNKIPISGRIGKAQKPLRPGSYRMTITAADGAGNASQPVALPFRILPPHK